jgi:hypothetical protein
MDSVASFALHGLGVVRIAAWRAGMDDGYQCVG